MKSSISFLDLISNLYIYILRIFNDKKVGHQEFFENLKINKNSKNANDGEYDGKYADLGVVNYFQPIHRAELFNVFPLGQKFMRQIQEELKIKEELSSRDQNKDPIKFLHEVKLNYTKHYEIYISNHYFYYNRRFP